MVLRRAIEMVGLRRKSTFDKDVEILVPRHPLKVLPRRGDPGPLHLGRSLPGYPSPRSCNLPTLDGVPRDVGQRPRVATTRRAPPLDLCPPARAGRRLIRDRRAGVPNGEAEPAMGPSPRDPGRDGASSVSMSAPWVRGSCDDTDSGAAPRRNGPTWTELIPYQAGSMRVLGTSSTSTPSLAGASIGPSRWRSRAGSCCSGSRPTPTSHE